MNVSIMFIAHYHKITNLPPRAFIEICTAYNNLYP